MYDKLVKEICVNVYHELSKYNIKGDDKKKFMEKICSVHINSIYNWKKESSDISNNIEYTSKYTNKNITCAVEQFIISLNGTKICDIKKQVTKTFNISLSYKAVKHVFTVNNIVNEKDIIKKNIEDCIVKNIKETPTLTAYCIQKIINNKFNKIVSTTYIYDVLSKNGITYKKVRIIKNPHSIEKQKEQLKAVNEEVKKVDINNIVSIDEISITQFETSYYGWSEKGQECQVDLGIISKGAIYNKRYSVLMATSNKKILNYTIVEKGLKGDQFNAFMIKLNLMDKQHKNIYFMDNARIHKTKKFNELCKKLNLQIIYNAPYQSKYNPIEFVFSLLRKSIQKGVNNTQNDICNIINIFNKNIKSDHLTNIFNHAFNKLNEKASSFNNL